MQRVYQNFLLVYFLNYQQITMWLEVGMYYKSSAKFA